MGWGKKLIKITRFSCLVEAQIERLGDPPSMSGGLILSSSLTNIESSAATGHVEIDDVQL